MMKRKINGASALVIAFVLMFFGIYNAHEWRRLKGECTETTWGEVTDTHYVQRSGWRADVRFSVNDRTYGFETGRSIRRINEENLIVRYSPENPYDCYSQDYPPPNGLLFICIASAFAVMGVIMLREKSSQQ